MKMVKKLPFLLLVAAPFFIPVQTKANWFGDVLRDIFGGGKHKQPMGNHYAYGQQGAQGQQGQGGNSVPLDGGTVFLMVAGLGLGAKMLYDAKAKKKVAGGL
ncbi:MAG TPA: hypothetical protein VHD83_23475 [Puia sp.]|nr:hypothetical protein [Puia sp.]